ncbi:MAG: M23 family metallopeptidase [Candidatus Sphingomonas phytovorans]|nr:M23 family metallopeptidase [Sphingomonas sp.]WEK00298.1 MAG: M23 family metallopeptidase [Sphingomonas sp.]
MRKLGRGFLMLICGIIGVFIALVLFGQTLPDAKQERRVTMDAAKFSVSSVRVQAASDPHGLLAIPVAGVARGAIADSWEDPRDGGAREHHGTDILAAGGTPVTAAAPGTIEKLFKSTAGGTTLYVRSPDRLWVYYYAHLSGYAPGVHEGQVVKVGDSLGYVGDTGNAGAGNFHLHFGLGRATPEQHWYQAQDVNPYPYLAGKPSSR